MGKFAPKIQYIPNFNDPEATFKNLTIQIAS